jgi:hypothetical protein
MPGQQQHGVLQLALAVGDRALAEFVMVPSAIAATSTQPQMINQAIGSRPRAIATRRSVAAVTFAIPPRILEIDPRIPRSQDWEKYNAEMA